MTSLYLTFAFGLLAGVLLAEAVLVLSGARLVGSLPQAERKLRRRLAVAAVRAAVAFLVVAGVRLWMAGSVGPSLAAAGLVFGEGLWYRRRRGHGAGSALGDPSTLVGLWAALLWPVAVAWALAAGAARTWSRGHLRRRRWLPLVDGSVLAALTLALFGRQPDPLWALAGLLATLHLGQGLPRLVSTLSARLRRRAPPRRRLLALMRSAATGALAAAVAGLVFLNLYVYRGFGQGAELIRRGSSEVRAVALTFDDGPNPEFTPAILDVLKRYGAPATFFVVGQRAERYPEIVRRMVQEGHEVGNHSYSHSNLLGRGREKLVEEIEGGTRALEKAAGVRPLLFRPPRGAYDGDLLRLLEQKGQRPVLYSLSGRDWLEPAARDIASFLLRRVRPGEIILLHDSGGVIHNALGNRSNTVRALPALIEGLRRQGYQLVTVSELLRLSHRPQAASPDLAGSGGA